MFGRRTDGVSAGHEVDPIIQFAPYIMPTRVESQNLITFPVEYEPMAEYIRKHKAAKEPITFMTILIAAFVRAVSENPTLNRFIVNRKLYKHKEITVSYIVLRDSANGEFKEAEVKLHCDPGDTIFEIAKKLNEKTREARNPEADNGTVDFAAKMLKIPLLPNIIVAIAKFFDRYGWTPKWLVEISPFHCSMFVTNMMSINLPSIYHHLYNYGTCSVFLSIGRPERHVVANNAGVATRKIMVPIGATVDERCCGGAEYAKGMQCLFTYLKNPELLESPPRR